MSFKSKMLLWVFLFGVSSTTWAADLERFNAELLKSIQSSEDIIKNSKIIRIRAEAEAQNLTASKELPPKSAEDWVILFHLASLENAATGMTRTSQVQRNWESLLKLHSNAKVTLWSERFGEMLRRVGKKSIPQIFPLTVGYFASLPSEVYNQMPKSSLEKHCTILATWGQTKPALTCYTNLEKIFEDSKNKEDALEVFRQKAQIYIATGDEAGLESWLKAKTNFSSETEYQLLSIALDQLKGNLDAAQKKIAELEKSSSDKKTQKSIVTAKARNLALQKNTTGAIQLLEPLVSKLDNAKPQAGHYQRWLLANLYLADKKPAKALEVLQNMETFPKFLNHFESMIIDTQKCAIWKNLKKPEQSSCSTLATQYSTRQKSFNQTEPEVNSVIEIMKILGKPALTAADQKVLDQTKESFKSRRNQLDPLFLVLSL